uniref:RUSC2_0 protein n=2 Tax=Fopius arisanus TaxID=64838 RepID=A0A0C9PQ90_9HYME
MMLVVLLCVIMKIAELSVGPLNSPLARESTTCDKPKRRCRIPGRNVKNRNYGRKSCGRRATMMEDPQTPGSDCNSNPADPNSQDLIGSEFIQDNSDYQWFIDYGYRDGSLHVHPSVLSSLSMSYTQDDLGYYDDLARNLDANLAEVDMESFRTADIHTLLTALPVMCTDPVQQSEFNYQRERYASISGSVMEKIDIGSSISPHSSSQGEDSACSTTDTISICKSSLLFSPVKETPMLPPGGSYSVDSLDCEDMLLTCQTHNKNNYTIAFEGSMTMYSDASQDFESQEKSQKSNQPRETFYNTNIDLKNMMDLSMACSDSKIYTTWSNLKHSSNHKVMIRHGSGNNNTIANLSLAATALSKAGATATPGVDSDLLNTNKRSQSLPDLRKAPDLNHSSLLPLNFSIDSAESNHQNLHNSGLMSRSINESSTNSTTSGKKIQNMSLVKLFMKQKSMSAEGMSLTLDQSDSASDNDWPTSNNNSNSHSSSDTNTNTQIHRKNINEKSNIPENDFTINWLKTECHRSTSSNEVSSSNTSKRIPSIKEFKEESPSVEELSESLLKSEADVDKIHIDERQTPSLRKTTGIQTITEVEENGVQTSLLYSLGPPKNNMPYLRETLVDKKPVYVVYPNYTLPDLSFLKAKESLENMISLKPHERIGCKKNGRTTRPFSCNDIEALKQRGFSHIKDWESLTFLLPSEYRKILHDVPDIPRHVKLGEETRKPLFCLSPPMRHRMRMNNDITAAGNVSSSSSTATQPSSGYRGSSTILTDSSLNPQGGSNPLYLYRYDSMSSENSLINQDRKNAPHQPGPAKRSVSLPQGDDRDTIPSGKVPPRPPLPRSILRKPPNSNKRYSMFEIGVEETERQSTESNKRMSLQEPYYINNDHQLLRHGRIIDSDKDVDEVEERRYVERMKEAAAANLIISEDELHIDETRRQDDIKQLEEFLRRSGFSSNSSDDGSEDSDIKLRSYVRKFLALKMNKDVAKGAEMLESQKKTVSFAVHQRKAHLAIKGETNGLDNDKENTHALPIDSSEGKPIDLNDRFKFIGSVSKAVDLLIRYWQSDPKDEYEKNNECAQLCLSYLCPTLYAIMTNGLKPHLNSTFGPISNSVWQVVEASSQQGPLTNTLNDLVQKINSEDFMTEGLLKFHAFVFGLLNLRALDAWFAYLCTRESILRKHYTTGSLFVAALGCAETREVIDNFLGLLQPLAFCPFELDLLYQYRQLHNSFGNANGIGRASDSSREHLEVSPEYVTPRGMSPKKVRPRSCGYDDTRVDPDNAMKKRWSNLIRTSKVPLDDSEDYTDSLEHSPLMNRGNRRHLRTTTPDLKAHDNDDNEECNSIPGELKFRKLQEKWELMMGKEEAREAPLPGRSFSPNQTPTSVGKSKIPRLLTSPVKQVSNALSGNPKSKSPVSGIPTLKKSIPPSKLVPKKHTEIKSKELPRRTSRVDQEHVAPTARPYLTRPSSLPYKSHGITAKEKNLISPQRRAASTSLPRANTPAASKNPSRKKPLKEVRTLSHRLPSDNGHLSFNEGDRLKVILEVDNKWLLCAKGERKGLVPRSCVQPYQT